MKFIWLIMMWLETHRWQVIFRFYFRNEKKKLYRWRCGELYSFDSLKNWVHFQFVRQLICENTLQKWTLYKQQKDIHMLISLYHVNALYLHHSQSTRFMTLFSNLTYTSIEQIQQRSYHFFSLRLKSYSTHEDE